MDYFTTFSETADLKQIAAAQRFVTDELDTLRDDMLKRDMIRRTIQEDGVAEVAKASKAAAAEAAAAKAVAIEAPDIPAPSSIPCIQAVSKESKEGVGASAMSTDQAAVMSNAATGATTGSTATAGPLDDILHMSSLLEIPSDGQAMAGAEHSNPPAKRTKTEDPVSCESTTELL